MVLDDRIAKFSFAKRYRLGNKRPRKQFDQEVNKEITALPKQVAVARKKMSEAVLEDSEGHGSEHTIGSSSQCSEVD